MEFTIFHTGSGGNSFRLKFADGVQVLLDAGKTSKYNAFNDFCTRGDKVSNYAGMLISHAHKDHEGAVADFERVGMPRGVDAAPQLRVGVVPLVHGAPCNGYIIANTDTREACIFLIDFTAIVSPRNFFTTLRWLVSEKYKIMFAVELSFCEFLYKKMPIEQRVGLDRHLSDEGFIDLFKVVRHYCRLENIVTLHASGREILNKGFHADVAPRDYLIKYLKVRLGAFVNIGQNGMTYKF